MWRAADYGEGLMAVDGVSRAGPAAMPGLTSALRSTGLLFAYLLMLGIMWLGNGSYFFWHGPNGTSEGMDFAMFYSAAHALGAGSNPYDPSALHHSEIQLLLRHGLAIVPANMARVAAPPLMFWLMQPLVRLPFQAIALVWIVLMYALALSGFAAALHRLGQTQRRPLVLLALSPPLLFAVYCGNVDGLVLGTLGWGFYFARSRPLLAGALASLACVKPQVGLPLALLILLFHSSAPRRSVLGFIGTVSTTLVLTLLTTGVTSIAWWLEGMRSFSHNITVVPDMTSAAGLYIYNAPAAARPLFGVACCLLWAAVALLVWLRFSGARPLAPAMIAPLWIAWMLLTPFAHYHDFALLALPVAMLWYGGDVSLRRPLAVLSIVGCYAAGFLFRVNGVPLATLMIGIPAIVVIVLAWRSTGREIPGRLGLEMLRFADH